MTLRFPLASGEREEAPETAAGPADRVVGRLLLVDPDGRAVGPVAELLSGRVGELRHVTTPAQVAAAGEGWRPEGIVLVQRAGADPGLPGAVASRKLPTVLLVARDVPPGERWALPDPVAEASLPLDPEVAGRLLEALARSVHE